MVLLYQASIDGFEAENFHKKCDGKNFTVTLVLTETNIMFGGFTELTWDVIGYPILGEKGFIFCLNENKIYYNKGEYIIYGKKDYGPFFFDAFYINGKNGINFQFHSDQYFDIPSKDYDIIWKNKFLLKDYLVFQLEIY